MGLRGGVDHQIGRGEVCDVDSRWDLGENQSDFTPKRAAIESNLVGIPIPTRPLQSIIHTDVKSWYRATAIREKSESDLMMHTRITSFAGQRSEKNPLARRHVDRRTEMFGFVHEIHKVVGTVGS